MSDTITADVRRDALDQAISHHRGEGAEAERIIETARVFAEYMAGERS